MTDIKSDLSDGSSTASSDDDLLRRLGYQPVLSRDFSPILDTCGFATVRLSLSLPLCSRGSVCSGRRILRHRHLRHAPAPRRAGLRRLVLALRQRLLFATAASIAEIVSASPIAGGIYSAVPRLVPDRRRRLVAYVTAWLNLTGQTAGVASVEFSLARLVLAAVAVCRGDGWTPSSGQLVGTFAGFMVFYALLNSMPTKQIARVTRAFLFLNLAAVIAIFAFLGARGQDPQPASFVFTDFENTTGWRNDGIAFLFGLLSVTWTMTDWDAAAHIGEEVQQASRSVPWAILFAWLFTAVAGFGLNVILAAFSGDRSLLPGAAGLSAATILSSQLGKAMFLFVWTLVILVGHSIVLVDLQANARAIWAFSRDRGLPDGDFFAQVTSYRVPVRAVWLVALCSIALGCLQFASPVALNAVFALCACALDLSYALPLLCKIVYRHETRFRPGPFSLGPFSLVLNAIAVCWTCFTVVILALPTMLPVTAANMNYAAPMTGLVLLVSGVTFVSRWTWFTGPRTPADVLEKE